jgi:hypothetical protein
MVIVVTADARQDCIAQSLNLWTSPSIPQSRQVFDLLSLSPRLSGHRVVVDHGFGRRANDLVFGTVVAFLCGCDCDHLSC